MVMVWWVRDLKDLNRKPLSWCEATTPSAEETHAESVNIGASSMVLNAEAPIKTDQHGISNQPCKGRTNGEHHGQSSTARQQRRKEQEQGSAMSKSFWHGRQLR